MDSSVASSVSRRSRCDSRAQELGATLGSDYCYRPVTGPGDPDAAAGGLRVFGVGAASSPLTLRREGSGPARARRPLLDAGGAGLGDCYRHNSSGVTPVCLSRAAAADPCRAAQLEPEHDSSDGLTLLYLVRRSSPALLPVASSPSRRRRYRWPGPAVAARADAAPSHRTKN